MQVLVRKDKLTNVRLILRAAKLFLTEISFRANKLTVGLISHQQLQKKKVLFYQWWNLISSAYDEINCNQK